ncbi:MULTISPECIES: hypothetical protein [unclassified Polaribacter]|nr:MULTISPECIES: hypothetical protein [unclassified Polaribacter]
MSTAIIIYKELKLDTVNYSTFETAMNTLGYRLFAANKMMKLWLFLN